MKRLTITLAACALACGRVDPAGWYADAGEVAPPPQCEVDADCAVTRVPACGGCATLCPPVGVSAGELLPPLAGCPAFECRVLGTFAYMPACEAGACVAVPQPIQ
jgi:hypothetical protein